MKAFYFVCFAVALTSINADASEITTNELGITNNAVTTNIFQITLHNKIAVTINSDGKVTYGESYKPDAAAKAFWDSVGLERAERDCKSGDSGHDGH